MLLVLGVYLLTMSGHTYSTDEETMLASSWALVESGRWDIHPSGSWVHTQGVDGRYYSVFGPGQQFAAIPWVAVGLLVDGLFPSELSGFPLRLVLSTFNALIVAGLCALLAAVGMALGYSEKASLTLGGTMAFATFLWPHSRTFFAEPMVALLFLASFYLVLRPGNSARVTVSGNLRRFTSPLALSGLLFSLSLLFKVQYAVAPPAFLIYIYLKSKAQRRIPSTPEVQSSPIAPRSSLLAWLSGLALGLLPLLIYNWLIFGNPLRTGYGSELAALFKTPLWEGAFGLLLSPGKGLVWFALPVVLSVAGARRFFLRHKAEFLFVLGLALTLIIFFGMFHLWWGGGSWGPRFLVPLVPFALLPALPVLQRAMQKPSFVARRLAIAVIIALGFALNLLGVLVNFDTYVNSGVDEQRRIWEPGSSPLGGHFDLAGKNLRLGDGLLTLLKPSRTIILKRGFSYSEGDRARGELLPRWTTGNGGLELRPDLSSGPVTVTLRLIDHRPPEMPRADVTLLLNDLPAAVATVPVEGSPISTDYSFSVAASPAVVEVRSPTWNPAQSGTNNRNEDLGLKLESISVIEGGVQRGYLLLEDLPPPVYYATPRWYYDLDARHPADLWFVYMARTGMGNRAMLALGAPIVLLAVASLGAALLWRRDRHSVA
jgi:hypothetical protein